MKTISKINILVASNAIMVDERITEQISKSRMVIKLNHRHLILVSAKVAA
jgi:hypothetical protein